MEQGVYDVNTAGGKNTGGIQFVVFYLAEKRSFAVELRCQRGCTFCLSEMMLIIVACLGRATTGTPALARGPDVSKFCLHVIYMGGQL